MRSEWRATGAGVTAKDIILALLAKIGIGGGTGHVFEYAGSAIRSLTMEERMTICNMSIEGGARAGMIAPDDQISVHVGERIRSKGERMGDATSAVDGSYRRMKELNTTRA